MSSMRVYLSSNMSIPLFLVSLVGLSLLVFTACGGCEPPAPMCVSAADCAGADMACENGKCVARQKGDGSVNTETPTPDNNTTPDNTTKPDTRTTPDNTTGPKDIGQVCNAAADCITGLECKDPGGLGIKVCTSACQASTKCGSKGFCDKHDGLKEGICLPKCTTSSDCSGVMDLCTVDGHCWKKGGIGALCQDAGECADSGAKCLDPGGLGPKVCTKECTDNAACGAGNVCDKHPGVTNYCLPGCNTNADCNVLPHMDLCTQEKHCWKKGNAGSLCSQKGECLDGFDCNDPGGLGPKICFKTCSGDADCNVDGIQGKCGDPGSGSKICLPSCTGDAECVGYPHMGKCNNGQCWK